MPAPFSTQHNSYLRNYKMTGKAKILNKTREVIALHKERHVFPIRLSVTKIQQGDQDAYMAVIKVGMVSTLGPLLPPFGRAATVVTVIDCLATFAFLKDGGQV